MIFQNRIHRSIIFSIATAVLLTFTLQKKVTAEALYTDNLTANEIIKRMEKVYANCKSYSDSGVVKTVFISPDVTRTEKKPFTTAFIRPDHFRFEFKEKKKGNREQRFIIYLKGKDLQTYWNIKNDLKPESLDSAIASATGVSGGSAITVPAMLLPNEIKWRRAIRFRKPKRIDDELFDKVDCYRVHDLIFNIIPTTIWIDKKTFLLRKIYREQEFDDFRTQETTTYNPILNGNVADNLLEFNPPTEKRWWQFW
jgi:outer membrane lipoprotein-sorting protein